jgi:hypothetical protein
MVDRCYVLNGLISQQSTALKIKPATQVWSVYQILQAGGMVLTAVLRTVPLPELMFRLVSLSVLYPLLRLSAVCNNVFFRSADALGRTETCSYTEVRIYLSFNFMQNLSRNAIVTS